MQPAPAGRRAQKRDSLYAKAGFVRLVSERKKQKANTASIATKTNGIKTTRNALCPNVVHPLF